MHAINQRETHKRPKDPSNDKIISIEFRVILNHFEIHSSGDDIACVLVYSRSVHVFATIVARAVVQVGDWVVTGAGMNALGF